MTPRQKALSLLEQLDDITCIDYKKAFENLMHNYLTGKEALEAIEDLIEEEGYSEILI